jgi:hypothetical protein
MGNNMRTVAERAETLDMNETLQKLDGVHGSKFCLVWMEVIDPDSEKVKLTPVYGTARILPDRLVVEETNGKQQVVPDSALPSVYPSDGTDILKDSEYYVIVKVGNS